MTLGFPAPTFGRPKQSFLVSGLSLFLTGTWRPRMVCMQWGTPWYREWFLRETGHGTGRAAVIKKRVSKTTQTRINTFL